MATPLSNSACTLALHDVGKATLPSVSSESCACAAPGESSKSVDTAAKTCCKRMAISQVDWRPTALRPALAAGSAESLRPRAVQVKYPGVSAAAPCPRDPSAALRPA